MRVLCCRVGEVAHLPRHGESGVEFALDEHAIRNVALQPANLTTCTHTQKRTGVVMGQSGQKGVCVCVPDATILFFSASRLGLWSLVRSTAHTRRAEATRTHTHSLLEPGYPQPAHAHTCLIIAIEMVVTFLVYFAEDTSGVADVGHPQLVLTHAVQRHGGRAPAQRAVEPTRRSRLLQQLVHLPNQNTHTLS